MSQHLILISKVYSLIEQSLKVVQLNFKCKASIAVSYHTIDHVYIKLIGAKDIIEVCS